MISNKNRKFRVKQDKNGMKHGMKQKKGGGSDLPLDRRLISNDLREIRRLSSPWRREEEAASADDLIKMTSSVIRASISDKGSKKKERKKEERKKGKPKESKENLDFLKEVVFFPD